MENMELVDSIKRSDERIKKYIYRITNITVKESVFVKNLSKEDYYVEVIYVFYEDRVDGFKDYSSETLNILKEAVEYLKELVEQNKSNKDIDIRKYLTAIWNGEELISSAKIMDAFEIDDKMLLEIARLNVGSDSNSPFPSNIYDLRMWSNDHDPIHFHVTNKQEGWKVTCSIEGNVLSIKKQTPSLNIKKVEKLCKEWLNGTNKYGINNKQNAKSIWDSIHS